MIRRTALASLFASVLGAVGVATKRLFGGTPPPRLPMVVVPHRSQPPQQEGRRPSLRGPPPRHPGRRRPVRPYPRRLLGTHHRQPAARHQGSGRLHEPQAATTAGTATPFDPDRTIRATRRRHPGRPDQDPRRPRSADIGPSTARPIAPRTRSPAGPTRPAHRAIRLRRARNPLLIPP